MKKLNHMRRSAASLLLCLLAAVIYIAAVGAADMLESRYALRADLSFNSVTTQSEATRNVLSRLTRDVHAYAVFSEGNELTDLSALLDRYQASSTHFSWSRENLSRNPLLLQWVSDDLSDSAVTTDCLVIRCEETSRTRVLTWADYVAFGYNPESGQYEFTGLTYEKSLTSAILAVTSDELPQVQLLSGHGELTREETATLESHLANANYECTRIDLRHGDALDEKAPLLILSPTSDISDTELDQMLMFVQKGGSLFVTVDLTDPDQLPNLYALYRLYGVEPLPGAIVADSNDRSSYYSNPVELTPIMHNTDATQPLIAAEANFIILAPARALSLIDNGSVSLLRQIVLESGEGAYRRVPEKDSVDLNQQPDDQTGPFVLAVLCDRGFDDGTRSRAFFIGNSSAFTSEQVYSLSYSNELLLQVMQVLRGSDNLDLSILPRDAVRPAFNDRGSLIPVLLLTVPPLLVAVLAVAVLQPRKYL